MGILYEDSVFAVTANVIIDGSITDASHGITLTADPGNRHLGVAGAGVVVNAQNALREILVSDPFVTLEWIELVGLRGPAGPPVPGPSARRPARPTPAAMTQNWRPS